MATGDYIGVLDHDDFLSSDALFRVVEALQRERYDVLYSDEDYVDENGQPVRPNFKPDWSPELLSNCMYMGHLVVASKQLCDPPVDSIELFGRHHQVAPCTCSSRAAPETSPA